MSSDTKKSKPLAPGEPPPSYICPLTHKMMKDPVMATDGESYDRDAIVAWFEEHGAIHHLTKSQNKDRKDSI